jgi:hypothetical protein
MDDNGIDGFDQADTFFWLYGKVKDANFSSAFNKARYAELKNYRGEKTIKDVVKEIRDGKNADTLRDILGPDLYTFIQQIPLPGKPSSMSSHTVNRKTAGGLRMEAQLAADNLFFI